MNHPMGTVTGTYDASLVILSYVVAVLASYTALDLGGRVSAVRGRIRQYWVFGGAAAMGLGIWSMHFVGMLALHMPLPVHYDLTVVLLSMLYAMAASLVALYVVGRESLGLYTLLIAGVLMGSGIVAMHYTGMSAMKMDAGIEYDPVLVAASVAIAVTASIAAMALTFMFRRITGRRGIFRKLASGLVMGAAIAGMHYTGMFAAHFYPANGAMVASSGLDTGPLALFIAGATILILLIALLSSFADRRIIFHSERSLANEHHYQSLFDNNADAIFSLNPTGRIVAVNPAAETLTGFPVRELVGMEYVDLLYGGRASANPSRFAESRDGPSRSFGLEIQHKDGQRLELQVTNVPIRWKDELGGVYFIAKDVTESRRAERRIHHLAYYDELTGLPNRRQFLQEGEGRLKVSQEKKEYLALLTIDIDRFKVINGSVGQARGDLLLRQLSERLRDGFDGQALVARVGSDEFALLLSGGVDDASTRQRVADVLARIQRPLTLEEREVHLTFSVGYSVAPTDGEGFETLLKYSEMALLHTKRRNKSHLQSFEPAMLAESQRRLEIEAGLRRGLDRKEFEVHYQPQFDLQGRLVGAEALVRWRDPVDGLVSPGTFIPVAEDSGLIQPLGEWVLRTACSQVRAWKEAGMPSFLLSVNLSIKQFEQPDLIRTISTILDETGFDPRQLELEITESMAMDVDQTLAILGRLKSLGIRISMDDFGTGYSSLSYLQRFPIDQLKIDQSFVRDIGTGNGASIVETIIAMAHHLGLKVVAEGVEEPAQLDFLKDKECDLVQGYLLGRPMGTEDFKVFLASARQS